jgi:TonB family protein
MGWAILISAAFHLVLISLLSATPNRPSSPRKASIDLQVSLPTHENGFPALKPKTLQEISRSNIFSEQNATSSPPLEAPEQLIGLSLPIKYYEAKELDQVPKPLVSIEPVYPPEALARQEDGAVQLELFIDEKGEIESIDAISINSAEIFREAAVSAFERQRFSPGLKNGMPVKSHIRITVKFGN